MKRFAICLLVAGLAVFSRAAVLGADAEKGLVDRAAVIRSAKEVTRAKYPNADDVLVDDYILIRYRPDGTSVTLDDTFMKVLTEKGKRENQTLSFHFTLPYSKVAAKIVEVIKPDGRTVPVDVAKQSRVMVNRSQMGANIYNPNSKILRVGVPGLEIGDMVHYLSERKTVKARVPDTWSDYTVLEYTSPIKHFVYEVHGPKELPLRRMAVKDEVKGTVKRSVGEKDGVIRYRWEVKDVPRMYREPSMPPLHTVVQRLLVSTIPEWKEISKWYWKLSEPHFAPTPEMKQTVAALTKGVADRQKKIEAIFQFVSQKIRYMGITTEKESPGYEPHDVKTTFEQKYGVCRDKAALLVAMLRLAGFEAYPVLIHNGPKKDPDVPQPYFNHAASCVQNPDGTYLLMDSTDENTKQLFPAYLSDQSYLVAKPEGETLLTSPIVSAEENLMRIETRGRLNAAGDLSAESILRFDGINDNAYRGYFSRIKPEERRRYFEGVVKRVVAGARLVDFRIKPKNMLDTSQPLTVRMKLEAKNVLVAGGDTVMLPVPWLGTRVGMVNFILGRTGLEKRKYPLVTKITCGVRESLHLEVADALGKDLAMPEYAPIKDETVTWGQSLGRKGKMLEGKSQFLMKVVEFTPAQYLGLKNTLKKLEYNARKMPIFTPRQRGARKRGPGVDVVVLDEQVRYELADAHTWTETRTVKKKILTYAGKKRHSELKFNYNPVWEELKLGKATVTGKDGKARTIQPEEINVMDAGWVGAAPRYPAAKTLVASLPGVEVGSVIEYRIKRTCRNRPFFAMREYFRGFEPIRRKDLHVNWPKSLKTTILSDVTQCHPVAQMLAGRARNQWTAQAMKSVKRERNLPPWWSFNPKVFLSVGGWKAYAADVLKAFEKAASGQTQAEARARDLVGEARDVRAKLIAIRDFVAKNVRAAGPALHELPLAEVTSADQTLAEGYGNTADRGVLIYVMLRAAGLKPEFLLASSEPMVANLKNPLNECPDAAVFGSVLVRVRDRGEQIYLNDTNQYASLGATPHDGCFGLVLKTGRIETISAAANKEDRSEVEYRITLSENGDAVIRKTRRVFGMGFAAFHRRFAEMPPEERRRYHQEAVAAVAKAARAKGDLVTRFDTYPGIEEFAVTVEKFAVRDGDYLYLTIPETLRGLLTLRSDTREGPIYWSHPRRIIVSTAVVLPPRTREVVLRPPALEWNAIPGAGRITVFSNSPGIGDGPGPEIPIQHVAKLCSAIIRPADYKKLLEIQRRLSHPRARTILLRKTR